MLFVRLIAFACAVAVPVASAATDLAQMALLSKAEACCEAMHGACAGLSAPDDCCNTPQLSQPAGTTLTVTKALITFAAPAIVAGVFSVEPAGREKPSPSSLFTRAHDPPHLHPVSLRI